MKLPFLWWSPLGNVPEVSPLEFHSWLEGGRPLQVVDARTSLEYDQGTIAQALHAPVTEMPSSIQRLALDPDRPVVVLCLTGHRSRPGTRWLRAHGFKAYSLRGGVGAWKHAGFTTEKPIR
jgi:rhodanese-related sulfurtransferase